MKLGPKYKICKRLGPDVFEKCQTPRFALVASRAPKTKRGGKRGGRPSRTDYGKHMLEKQRVRFTYGLSERQFARYVKESARPAGAKPAEALYRRIESRLDNIVYRLSLARTRAQARQLVSHGLITVNDRKMSSPSYAVRVGERIGVKQSKRDLGVFASRGRGAEGEGIVMPPAWLTFDGAKMEGVVSALPAAENAGAQSLDLQAVIEFYSR
ncbi:MAG: 30S ribosomal protein S4 [bacterium]|nr:30S ribosomal protein S4 [bacterium]MDZ4284701.1 30S ribosomal protein S4 [Patescibacteria group bacterium]